MTTSTLVRQYHPRGAAAEVFDCRDSEVLLSGPAGTGKSRGCLEKLHMMCLVNPGMRGLIVRKTRESLGSTALVTWREHVATEALASGLVSFYGGSAEEPPQYRYTNKSKIMIGGMDKPTKIMSSEYDIVYAQEATELTTTDWENITTRLRNGRVSFQQLMADCNPDIPTHWLKQRCDSGATRMIHCRHEDNPILFDDDGKLTERGAAYISKLDALTGVRYQRLRKGLWAAAEGLIYEQWNPTVHIVPQNVVRPEWRRLWCIDFGYTNPFVWQEWAEDGDGRLYLVREIYQTKTLVEDHARAILNIVAPGGRWTTPRPRAIICDHDAEDRATLQRHLSMGTIAAHKTVKDGIQAVQARLRPAGDGKPRLFICENALASRDPELVEAKKPTCSAEEIVGYVWEPPAAGKPPKEQPVKADDHGMDAMRYAVAERDLRSQPRVRWM